MKTNHGQNTDATSPPSHTACAGVIRACVWESQDAEHGVRHKILISRLFKDDGGWQRGRTFYASELAALVEAVAKAQRWIEHRRRQLGPPQPTTLTAR
jgi:hypothetical protein